MKSSLRSTHSVISAKSAEPRQPGQHAETGYFRGKLRRQPDDRIRSGHRHLTWKTAFARGFTLMETLVALGLLVAIMSSLSSGIHLYWKYRRLSQDSMTTSKLTRGIIEDLTCDLRAVSPPQYLMAEVVDGKRAAAGKTGFSGPAANVLKEKILNVTESTLLLSVSETTPVHFYGTERVLAMYTENESVRFVNSLSHPSGISKRHLIWKLAGSGSPNLPLLQIGPRQVAVRIRSSETERGLIRISRSLDNSAPTESFSEEQTLISESVESLTFRYFDGYEWFREWNSSARIGLPAAVEVKIRMQDQDEDLVSVIRLLSWQPDPLVRDE